jgi:hypothetical protein
MTQENYTAGSVTALLQILVTLVDEFERQKVFDTGPFVHRLEGVAEGLAVDGEITEVEVLQVRAFIALLGLEKGKRGAEGETESGEAKPEE